MAQRAISLPFSFNASGGLSYTEDETKIWQDRVAVVVMTKLRERVMRPTYGSNVNVVLFEALSVGFVTAKQTIESAFSSWLPQLTLVDVLGNYSEENSTIDISIIFKYKKDEETVVKLKTALLNRAGETILEVTNG